MQKEMEVWRKEMEVLRKEIEMWREGIRKWQGAFSRELWGYAENLLLLQQEGVRGLLRHRHQAHALQQASVKTDPFPTKKTVV